MSEPGTVFPPRDEWDILAYDDDEVIAGYREHRPDDQPPGDNRSPAYRWGWTNARRDLTRADDGFGAIRRAFIIMTGRPN